MKNILLNGLQIPEMSREARGTYIYNILPLDKDEQVAINLPINFESDNVYIFLLQTWHGLKKTALGHLKYSIGRYRQLNCK